MRIAVTGGAGFLGRHVRDLAQAAGHMVWSVDRSAGQDILDARLPEYLAGAEVVIHLAGVLGTHELFDQPEVAVVTNTVGTLRVLEACHALGAGYVGITMPDVFPSIYTATKVAAQRLASAFHHTHGVPVSHVRAFNAYGKGQAHGAGHPQKILPTFAYESWRGRPMPIWGDGSQTVDLICAPQLARLLVAATAFGDDRMIDGGTGHALSVMEVARMVARITSNPEVKRLPMRRGEVPTRVVAEGEGWGGDILQPVFCTPCFVETVTSYAPVPAFA